MRDIRCPNCNGSLPAYVDRCTACGESLPVPTQELSLEERRELAARSRKARTSINRPPALKVPHFVGFVADESSTTIEDDPLDDTIEDAWHSRTNWQRIVSARTDAIDEQAADAHPPLGAIHQAPTGALPFNPPPARSPFSRQRHMPPPLFFWISVIVLLLLVMGGLLGVVVAMSRGVFGPPPPQHTGPSLQITPSQVALGALITLHGSNFSPNGRVGLSYDASIPVMDTDDTSIIVVDKAGNFSDTVIVEPEWLAGLHDIHAEDASLHEIASFMLTVTGQSPSLRPAHLQLLTNSLDLGSADQATNSTKTITLTNIGGGQITWQSSVTQPWLLLSPKRGAFASSQSSSVVIAADRSNLKVGSYTASVIFTSNAGQLTLSVKMGVAPLQVGPGAVLQLTPPVLSFSAIDGGTDPPAQVVTISNPGVQSLQWNATRSVGDNATWLSVAPRSGSVARGGSEPVRIGVDVSVLLPGTYSGLVTFSAGGAGGVKDSPQSIYVSLTVAPQCMLQVSPGELTFAGTYLQAAPPAQAIGLDVTPGCAALLQWSAHTSTSNGRSWLKINKDGDASGTTPAYPSVSVATQGLAPGTYSGEVMFSTTVGTQALPVTLVLGQPTTPILATSLSTLSFNGVVGQPAPGPRTITITNSGGGTLRWSATAATSVGGAWLAVTPASGTLSARQSASVQVSVALLPSLTPNSYNGMITLSGADDDGNAALGSPQQIPVTFRVQAACSIAVDPTTLSFAGVAGQGSRASQRVVIYASGACAHRLDWQATSSTTSGGSWLFSLPPAGQVSPEHPSSMEAGVLLNGLTANTYTGAIRITATDHITHQAIGAPQDIAITLTVQPPCTLQTPSTTQMSFDTEAGSNPAAQTFSVGVIGACVGKVVITPTVSLASGSGWLAVTPASVTITGGSATFTVTIAAASLPAASYGGTISLSAVDRGFTISGSPQTVNVTLNVMSPPALSVGPSSLSFNVTSGQVSQPVNIANTGAEPLNWTAALTSNAPGFVTLSASSGTGLAGGANVSINVMVDASAATAGATYTTALTITAIDPLNGKPVAGSSAGVAITIRVAPPAMQLSASYVSFHAKAGNSTTPKSITVTNTGGGTLTWTTSVPSSTPWLTVSPLSGRDTSGNATTITLTADATGLTAGRYLTTVTITPSVGSPVIVHITFNVSDPPTPPPTPTPTPSPTPSPTATVTATR